MEPLVERVEQLIREERLIRPGDTVVVAVSGGVDSVALLHVLHRMAGPWQLTLRPVHVNHGFRGAESDEDAMFVKELCERLGWPAAVRSVNIPAIARETGENAQAAARRVRYDILVEEAEKCGASRIALAHHADDQAETVLMRFLRGAGSGGLAGMALKRKAQGQMELIRPFLRTYKMDIIQFCDSEGIAHREDSSNQKRKYARNAIRLDVLPYLSRFNPQLPQTLNQLAETLREENDYLDKLARDCMDRSVRFENAAARMNRGDLLALPVALQRRLIKLILNYLFPEFPNLDFGSIERIRAAAGHNGKPSLSLDLGEHAAFIREYESLLWTRGERSVNDPYEYELEQGQTRLSVAEAKLILEAYLAEEAPAQADLRHSDPFQAWFDAERLSFPLRVRSREAGDRMTVLGLNGSKKVKDMLVDAKIPPSDRRLLPVVTDSSGIVLWIPGLRRSAEALIGPETRRVLRIRVNRSESLEKDEDV